MVWAQAARCVWVERPRLLVALWDRSAEEPAGAREALLRHVDTALSAGDRLAVVPMELRPEVAEGLSRLRGPSSVYRLLRPVLSHGADSIDALHMVVPEWGARWRVADALPAGLDGVAASTRQIDPRLVIHNALVGDRGALARGGLLGPCAHPAEVRVAWPVVDPVSPLEGPGLARFRRALTDAYWWESLESGALKVSRLHRSAAREMDDHPLRWRASDGATAEIYSVTRPVPWSLPTPAAFPVPDWVLHVPERIYSAEVRLDGREVPIDYTTGDHEIRFADPESFRRMLLDRRPILGVAEPELITRLQVLPSGGRIGQYPAVEIIESMSVVSPSLRLERRALTTGQRVLVLFVGAGAVGSAFGSTGLAAWLVRRRRERRRPAPSTAFTLFPGVRARHLELDLVDLDDAAWARGRRPAVGWLTLSARQPAQLFVRHAALRLHRGDIECGGHVEIEDPSTSGGRRLVRIRLPEALRSGGRWHAAIRIGVEMIRGERRVQQELTAEFSIHAEGRQRTLCLHPDSGSALVQDIDILQWGMVPIAESRDGGDLAARITLLRAAALTSLTSSAPMVCVNGAMVPFPTGPCPLTVVVLSDTHTIALVRNVVDRLPFPCEVLRTSEAVALHFSAEWVSGEQGFKRGLGDGVSPAVSILVIIDGPGSGWITRFSVSQRSVVGGDEMRQQDLKIVAGVEMPAGDQPSKALRSVAPAGVVDVAVLLSRGPPDAALLEAVRSSGAADVVRVIERPAEWALLGARRFVCGSFGRFVPRDVVAREGRMTSGSSPYSPSAPITHGK